MQHGWDNDKQKVKETEKSKTKFAFPIKDVKMAVTPSNDKWNVEAVYPMKMDDHKIDTKIVCEAKPGKTAKFDLSAGIGLAEMSGIKAVVNGAFEQNMKKGDSGMEADNAKVVFSMAANAEKDWSAGFKV